MEIIYPNGVTGNNDIPCIYKVTNLKNGKVYIGQTVNFRKRSSDYKNAANRGRRYPIYAAIADDGHENFRFECIYQCTDLDKLSILEEHYIKEYDATNPEKGYNIRPVAGTRNDDVIRRAKSISHTGLKESDDTKRKKSNTILAIRDDYLIICDSGKLFGDYIGKSKDMIKNCLRQPSKVCGYRVYYGDFKKRREIGKKMSSKRSIRDPEYMDVLDTLDEIEIRGVETMYEYFDGVYRLEYDSESKTGYSLVEI